MQCPRVWQKSLVSTVELFPVDIERCRLQRIQEERKSLPEEISVVLGCPVKLYIVHQFLKPSLLSAQNIKAMKGAVASTGALT